MPLARLQPESPSRPIMRVIKPTSADLDRFVAERRLVAEMLCLEHGARAFGPNGMPLPEPHEPWPIVKLHPITATGIPSIIHYRPTVAVVYYTLPPKSSPRALIERLAAALEQAGDAHLRGYHAVAATPATVLRQKGRVIGGTVIVGARKCVKKRNAEKAGYPARLLQLAAPDDGPPPHYSIGAGFTWVFMPITAALAISAANFESMPAVNATLSAVYYDESQISTIPDGGDVARLTIGDFGAGDPPLFLGDAEALRTQAGRPHHEIIPEGGAVLIDLDGRLTFVGRLLNLHLKPGRGAWPPGRGLEQFPTEAWAPETILRLSARPGGADETSRDFQCVNCAAPLGGTVAVIRAPRAPDAPGYHNREWLYIPAAPNSLLLKGAEADIGVLLCAFCWDALESPACLTVHLGARVTRTVLPFSQAEAAAACQGYKPLAPLLAGRAAQLAGAEGAYVVTTPAGPPADGASVILACEKLGRYPSITDPVIAATKLWVVTGVPLASVRRGAP